MSTLLLTIEDIIIGGKRPWVDNNLKSDAIYNQTISSQSKLNPTFETGSIVEFPNPVTPIRTYYFNLIQTTAVNFLNTIINLADNTTIKNEKLYWAHKEGHMPVVVLIEKLNTIIKTNSLSWEVFQGPVLGRDHEAKKRNSAYVTQTLKYFLLHILYELQFQFPDLIPNTANSLEELNNRYFEESLHKGILIEREVITNTPQKTQLNTKEDIINFAHPMDEDADENEPVITFNKILVNKEKYLSVEKQIHSFNLINKHSDFIKNKGQRHSEKLAAILAILFEKKYFNTECFLNGKGKTKITRTDIARIIEKRYTCHIERQFLKFTGKNNDLKAFLATESTFFKSLKA
ncbi:MAG: hypothetical protein KF825_13760 [Ferruginibacter sp.]|nr:hypothetical protein [Ferruginibacter sp.]